MVKARLPGGDRLFFFSHRRVFVSGPTKWCAFQFRKLWRDNSAATATKYAVVGGLKCARGACIIGLGLLLGSLLASAVDKKSELNEGLAAARAGDYVGAHAVWLSLARRGNAEAQFRLGWLHDAGLGTEKNPFNAVKWYHQAAAQGHANAQYNLGIMSAEGRGMPRDDTKAANYFLEAANQGHAKAQYKMGLLYQAGRGVSNDLRRARYWFVRARANGFVRPNKAAVV